ncbi:MAG: hypothetical protein II876_04785 [Synergistaceae bacterium]|nr:hypothetical protein [Synergistaceae bacterium]MBQ3758760.1 hypothetical protein [Synergistaceae bacterium]
MTHEEIVRELQEIRKYLEGKAEGLKARYGDKPDFATEMDEWHYELLMQVCRTVREQESVCLGAYLEVQVPDMQFAHGGYGVEI